MELLVPIVKLRSYKSVKQQNKAMIIQFFFAWKASSNSFIIVTITAFISDKAPHVA